jgi:hypothetical protein
MIDHKDRSRPTKIDHPTTLKAVRVRPISARSGFFRGLFISVVFTTDLLRSFFVPRLLPAIVAHYALIRRPARSGSRHSRLPAMFAALILLAF